MVNPVANNLKLRKLLVQRGMRPLDLFPLRPIDVHRRRPDLPVLGRIGLLPYIIDLASRNMKLRENLIKLTGGSLLCLPSRPILIHFRGEDLPERAIVLMPDIIDFISRDLKLWLVAFRGCSKEDEIRGKT
jgi:hypothetical protein